MLKDGSSLRQADARKPFNELVDGCAVFQILEERCHRHTRTPKKPGATVALGVVFNCVAG